MTVIEKPWGKEEILELNPRYMVKRLTMKKGHRCSIQYHEKKTETVYLLSGSLRIWRGDRVEALTPVLLAPGEHMTLVAGVIHRMEAAEESVYLESSTPETEDVVRLKDEYGRV